jgi:uncharacterized protein (TIGR04255 family)
MKSQAQYGKPPVVEVVTGVVFEPVRGFTIAHYGLFWQRLLNDFPEAKHAMPLGLEETPLTEPFFVPRIWLVNSSQGVLVQLQGNRFYFNWKEGPNPSSYSTYPKIYEQFQRYWGLYVGLLSEMKLPDPRVLKCELTYINHIPTSAGWGSMSDVGKVIAPAAWGRGTTGFLPPPKTLSWNATFDLPDGRGTLTAKMQPAFRDEAGKELILVLELAAGGPPSDPTERGLESWFSTAHEWIVKGFEDITDKDVQRSVWGKK